jgi:hypothetical protein
VNKNENTCEKWPRVISLNKEDLNALNVGKLSPIEKVIKEKPVSIRSGQRFLIQLRLFWR